MTTIHVKTLRASEAAFMLRLALGPARCWGDFLSDCIRDRTDFHGLQLLPIGYVKGRCRRPAYDAHEVAAFIREARLRCPPSSDPRKLATLTVAIDSATLKLPPRQRLALPVTPGTTT